MTMVSMPVDNSTLAITSIICAGLLFVFLLVAADDEFRKPPTAATIAIVAGGLLYWLGFIPIGIMIAAALALVGGIFRALKGNANQPNPSNKSAQQTTKRTNEQNVSAANHSEKVERFNQKTGGWEKLETDLDNHETQPLKSYAPLLHGSFGGKPKLYKSNSDIDWHPLSIPLGVIAAVSIVVGFVVSVLGNKDKSQATYTPSTTPPSATAIAPTNNQPVNPALMQQCHSYATANKRKELTLTWQEYNKFYEFCLDEAKKPTQTTSTNTTNNSHIETVSNELLQAYQMSKIDNETSRQYINKTWEDLIQTLPDNQKSGVLKLQHAWIKSKRNVCGKIESIAKSNANNLTPDELMAEIKLLECDSQANSERAAVLSKTMQVQDEIAKIIKEGDK